MPSLLRCLHEIWTKHMHPDCTNVENHLVFFVTNGVIPRGVCLNTKKNTSGRDNQSVFLICGSNVLYAFFCMEFLCLQALTGTSVLQQNASCLLISNVADHWCFIQTLALEPGIPQNPQLPRTSLSARRSLRDKNLCLYLHMAEADEQVL